MAKQRTEQFDKLLDFLKATRGFDFSGYKPSTLQRRIEKRMQIVNVEDHNGYLDYLQVYPMEFELLFNTILINVTDFFRDPVAWQYISEHVIPSILKEKRRDQQIRLWSAGCASGEEAFTLAMLMAEAMPVDEYRDRVKIYATDMDEEALLEARLATYKAPRLESVPPHLVEKYFEVQGDKYVFDRELRRSVIFGRHDLIQDAPISRVDLLACRNTLMYFNSETQERILARFHFALKDSGFLFLGKAETLIAHARTFVPVEIHHRVFAKAPRNSMREKLMFRNGNGNGKGQHLPEDVYARMVEAALFMSPVAQIVVDNNGCLAFSNERARNLFGLSFRDVGRPLQDLEISYRPIEIRSLIEEALRERRPVNVKEVEWVPSPADRQYFDVQVCPITGEDDEPLCVTVTYHEVTKFKKLQEDLIQFNQELETAYEELESTNEELQTTNEELQSTIEELETMNEELQSTNEELETMNDEAHRRTDELNHANAFLEAIMQSMPDGVVVVNHEIEILAWNEQSYELWGLRFDDVKGKHFFNLDIGLPVAALRDSMRATLQDAEAQETVVVDAINRRGRSFRCEVTCSPVHNRDVNLRGVMLLMKEVED